MKTLIAITAILMTTTMCCVVAEDTEPPKEVVTAPKVPATGEKFKVKGVYTIEENGTIVHYMFRADKEFCPEDSHRYVTLIWLDKNAHKELKEFYNKFSKDKGLVIELVVQEGWNSIWADGDTRCFIVHEYKVKVETVEKD